MIKRICLFVLAFIAFLACFIALMLPKDYYLYDIDDSSDRLVCKLYPSDISAFNDCHIDKKNQIIIDGADPYIVFSSLDVEAKSAVLNFAGNNKSNISIQLFVDNSKGYSEENSTTVFVAKSEKRSVIPTKHGIIKGLRVDINKDYSFSSIELHSSLPVYKKVKVHISGLSCFLSVTYSLICAYLVLIIDKKTRALERIIQYFKKRSKQVVKLLLSVAFSTVAAAIVELSFSYFTNGYSSIVFNFYRFFFIFGMLLCVFVLCAFIKSISNKPETVFLLLSLTVCITMIVVCPFGHVSWDVDSHYKWVLNASYLGKTTYVTQADINVIKVSPDYWMPENANVNYKNITKMNEDYKTVVGMEDGSTTIAHFPAGLFLALARLFNATFYEMTTFSRVANALLYCIICFLAIRKLKSGKMIAAVVSLIPTSIFLATNFSYDYFVNCFAILGMAYFVGIQQEKDNYITLRETAIMCAAFAFASVPKLVYSVLLIIPFFMSPKKIKNKKQYYFICVISMLLLFVMLALKSLFEIRNGGDARGGAEINTVAQVKFILGNLMQYIRILTRFLLGYLSIGNMSNYITNFAYMGIGKGSIAFTILIIVTTITDKNENDIKSVTLLSKIAVVMLYVGGCALIATALYIAFTPVAANTVSGCQARYIIPLLYPLISIIGIGFKFKFNRTIYNSVVLLSCIAVNFYNMYLLMLPYWIK